MDTKNLPMFDWYENFYHAVEKSVAYSEFCKTVFGIDFSQHGFSDIIQIQELLKIIQL